MPIGELTISVQTRRVWYTWLLWPLVRSALVAGVWLRLLHPERAYWLGARYLAATLRVRGNRGPWQHVNIERKGGG